MNSEPVKRLRHRADLVEMRCIMEGEKCWIDPDDNAPDWIDLDRTAANRLALVDSAIKRGAKVRDTYEAVHAELLANGDDWSKIDLAAHGFNITTYTDAPLSYENWQAYMQQRLLNDYHDLVRVLESNWTATAPADGDNSG